MDIAPYIKRLLMEKMVIGLEEPITISGVGDFIAKIDSGNSGYNVIHGNNLYKQGNVLTFETVDSNGKKQHVSKKLKEVVRINVGSGRIEKRPVIELDIKLGESEYKKIPFSVANRSTNKNKVLLCKDFINNELNALIDPSNSMLTKTQISEAVGDQQAAASGGTKESGLKKVLRGFQGLGKFTDAQMIGTTTATKASKDYGDLADIDKELIRKKIGCEDQDLVCYKLADYFGKFYQGGDNPTKAEQERYNTYIGKAAQQNQQQQQQQPTNNQQQTQQQERYNRHGRLLKEAGTQLATQNTQIQSSTGAAAPTGGSATPPNNTGATNTQQATQPTNTQSPQQQPQQNPKDQLDAFYANNRQNFIVYFYENDQGIKDNYGKFDKEVINANKQNGYPSLVDSLFIAIGDKALQFSTSSGETNITGKFLAKLKYLTEGDLASGINSGFAICWGEDKNSRQCWTKSVVHDRKEGEVISDTELSQAAEKMSETSKKTAQNYLQMKKNWQTNLFLKSQPLNLANLEELDNLQLALKQQVEANKKTKKKPTKESHLMHRGRLILEADTPSEQKEAPTPQQTNGVDLHLDDIKKEESDIDTILQELRSAINIVTKLKELARRRKAEGVEDEDWNYIIKCTYSPQLSESAKFLSAYFRRGGIAYF